VTRRRLAFLRSFVEDVASMRRRARGRRAAGPAPHHPDGPASDELARRLDETRARLRREIPPPGDDAPS
jgi:hypothetical protein